MSENNYKNDNVDNNLELTEIEEYEQDDFAKEEIYEAKLTLIQRIIKIFTSPEEAMRDIAAKPRVLVPLLLIIVLFGIFVFAKIDLFKEFTMDQIQQNLAKSGQNIEITDQVLNVAFMSGLITIAVAPLITIIFKSALAHGIIQLFNGKGKFKATLSVITFAYFVQILGEFIRTVIGILTDSYLVTTSLAVLLPRAQDNTQLFTLLSYFDIFSIWYLIVSLIGISIVHRVSKDKATIATFTPWFIMIGFSLVTLMFQG